MAQLIVRNLEADVRDRLRDLAQQHGRSMEEEIRDILRAAVVANPRNAGPKKLGTWISQQFARCRSDEGFDIPEHRAGPARPATFD